MICLRCLFMKTIFQWVPFATFIGVALLLSLASANGQSGAGYQIFVSNEKSGDLTVISGADFKVVATIPVGKRPRGIHASPDGKTVYVALSGTPIEPPPKLDANGNPIFQKDHDDDDNAKADKSADGIGMVDVAQKKFLRKIPAGSDPEQFCLSADGRRIYISNEDVGAATVLDAAPARLSRLFPSAANRKAWVSVPTENSSTSPARPPATFLPLTQKPTKSSAHLGCIRVRAAWRFCRTVRARSCRRNPSAN